MSLTGGLAIVAAILILGLSVALKFEHSAKLKHLQTITDIRAVGQAQEQLNKKNKAKTDAENKKLSANLATANLRMREQIAGSSFSGVSGSSETVCFDRAHFDRAIRSFAEGTGAIAGKGAEATLNLDSAKQWAQRN